MIVYISGPISGYSDKNKKAFSYAEKEIKKLVKRESIKTEIKVINPVKLGVKLDKSYRIFDKVPKWEDYMRVCIRELCKSDFVYLLPNWGYSEGAAVEKYLAERLKIPCAENINELLILINRGCKQ